MDQIKIPVGQLSDSNNYRRRFNPAAMAALVDDIKRQNLITPITIRPMDSGGYQVVAGHRRVKAFKEAFGDEAPIPAYVRIMSDAEATAAMVSENKIREDTSAIEDAEAATRLLGLLNGDKEETANRLGWTRQKLDRRLALMNSTDSVRDAYIEEKIMLGHVEILAAMRREVQENVLAKLLAGPAVPSVEQLKAMAEQVLQGLQAAIFDKADCGGCHFNTGNQQALFETSFSGSRCTNGECYGKKTEAELETRRQALTDTYQVVRIVRPGENMTVLPLRADGSKGVGEDQAKACRTCGDFGACVSAAPDKLGMTFKEVCFNSACNATKVEARIKAEKALEKAPPGAPATGDDAAGSGAQEPQGDTPQNARTERAATGKADSSKAKTASSEPRNVVREYREKIWRVVFSRGAIKLPVEKSRALLIAVCLFRPSTMDSHAAAKAVAKALQKEELDTHNAFDLASELLTLAQPQLGAALQQIPAYVSTQMEIGAIVGFLKALDIKLEQFWKVNETFFDLLTKTEIDAVCTEIGIDQAIGKDYSKLKNGGKADFIKAIVAIDGFEYAGKIPALMRW